MPKVRASGLDMGKRGRGRNEGTIFYRPDKQLWVTELRLPNGTRRTLYGKTRQDVQRKLAQTQRQIAEGLSPDAKRQKVAAYLTEWMEIKRSSVEQTTWERYERDVRLHLIPQLGRIDLAELQAQDVQRCYARRLADGASARSVHHMHAVLHAALDDALALGLVVRNVSEVASKPKQRRREMSVLTPEQAETFRQSIIGDRLEALYVLALATGMREGEMLALRWREADLERGVVRVVRNMKRVHTDDGPRWIVGEVKTKYSRRAIEIDDADVVSVLREHRKRQLEEKLHAGQGWHEQGLVFCSEIGESITGYQFRWRFHQALRRAGLPIIRPHDLRHTAATLMLVHGVDVKVVSSILGHSSVAITYDLYAHVMPSQTKQAASVMGKLLRRKVVE